MSLHTKITTEEIQETSAWLLESTTPSIRYLTLTTILGRPQTDPEVQTARRSITTGNPVLNILNKQQPEGYWQYQKHYYSPKYRSSHWSMLLLSELGLDPRHPALQKGADFMQDCFNEDKRLQRRDKTSWGCLWGNALRYQLYSQRASDPTVRKMLDFVVRDLQNLSRCQYNDNLPCAWGVARDLFGLALIPEEERDNPTKQAIQAGLVFLLKDYDLIKGDYPYIEKIHDLWSKISFPLFYQSDILFVLRIAKAFNALDYTQAQRGQDWLLSRRQKNGLWSGGSPYRSRTWPFMARGDAINRWITLHALNVLS